MLRPNGTLQRAEKDARQSFRIRLGFWTAFLVEDSVSEDDFPKGKPKGKV